MKDSTIETREFHKIKGLIEERTGIGIPKRNEKGLFSVIKSQIDADKNLTPGILFKKLESLPLYDPVWNGIVDKLVVTESYFFRDKGQIDVMKQTILPEIIETHKDDRRIRIWSAGCATGQEPYTVAILLKEIMGDLRDWKVKILATDINFNSLKKAKEGLYRPWSFRGVDDALIKKFFTKQEDSFKIRPDIAQMVTFRYLNLAVPCYPSIITDTSSLDLILCKNVTMYLKPGVMSKVIERFFDCLLPTGWLITGASEVGAVDHPDLEKINYPGTVVLRVRRPGDSGQKYLPVSDEEPVPFCQDAGPEVMEEQVSGRDPGKEVQDAAGDLLLTAKRLADSGFLEDAERLVRELVEKKDRLNPDAYLVLGMILQEKKDLRGAVEAFKKALYIDPESVTAHFRAALLYRMMNRKDAARSHVMEALRILSSFSPDDVVPDSGIKASEMEAMVASITI